MSEKSFETLAVHAGEDTAAHHGSVSVPIYNASPLQMRMRHRQFITTKNRVGFTGDSETPRKTRSKVQFANSNAAKVR
jgi:cystathionine beta-lyase/cystathionine gamma-synthase